MVYPQAGGRGTKSIWKKTSVIGLRRKVNHVVQAILVRKVREGYFNKLRRALTLYLLLKKEVVDTPFAATDLEKSLAVLSRVGGLLSREKIDMWIHNREA